MQLMAEQRQLILLHLAQLIAAHSKVRVHESGLLTSQHAQPCTGTMNKFAK
jgi:hypothetical protein